MDNSQDAAVMIICTFLIDMTHSVTWMFRFSFYFNTEIFLFLSQYLYFVGINIVTEW